jgi:hypothetical protein
MKAFAKAVQEELARARTQHPKPRASFHEAHAIIQEELDEFWDQVRLKESERDPLNALKELIQLGAMAQRAAEDLGLIESESINA